jgi:hypothetical protein
MLERDQADHAAHLAMVQVGDANCMVANQPGRAQKPAGKRRAWPSFGVGENGVEINRFFGVLSRAQSLASWGTSEMARREKQVEDAVITKARTYATPRRPA